MAKLKKFITLLLILVFLFSVTGSYLFSAKAQPEHEELTVDQKEAIEAAGLDLVGLETGVTSYSLDVAVEDGSVTEEETLLSTENNLTLKSAIAESIKNNNMLKSLDYVIRAKQLGIREALDNANRVSDDLEKTLDGGKVKYYLPYDAEVQYEIAKLDKLDQEDEISLAAMNAFVDALYTKEAVEVLDSGVNRAQEQVDIAKINYDVGTNTKVDVLSSEVQLENTKSELEQAKNTLQIKKMELNQVMNRDLTTPIVFEETDFNTEIPELTEAIVMGLENNIPLKKLNFEVDSIDKLLEVTLMYHNKGTYAYKSAESAKMIKLATIEETESKVELVIRSQQTKIDTLHNKYLVMGQQVKKVQETYDIMLHQYKAGFISYQELANQDQLLKQTSLEELQAKLDYYRAVYEYRYMIGLK